MSAGVFNSKYNSGLKVKHPQAKCNEFYSYWVFHFIAAMEITQSIDQHITHNLKKSFYGEIIRRVLSASKYRFLCCCIKLTLTFILLLSHNIYCDAQWSILCTIINLMSLIFFRSSIKLIGLFLTIGKVNLFECRTIHHILYHLSHDCWEIYATIFQHSYWQQFLGS